MEAHGLSRSNETSVISVTPVVYLKVAVGLDALYNTKYTQSMVDAIEPVSLTNSGYRDGVNENGQVVSTVIDKTNGLILAAALYAINHNVSAPSSLAGFFTKQKLASSCLTFSLLHSGKNLTSSNLSCKWFVSQKISVSVAGVRGSAVG